MRARSPPVTRGNSGRRSCRNDQTDDPRCESARPPAGPPKDSWPRAPARIHARMTSIALAESFRSPAGGISPSTTLFSSRLASASDFTKRGATFAAAQHGVHRPQVESTLGLVLAVAGRTMDRHDRPNVAFEIHSTAEGSASAPMPTHWVRQTTMPATAAMLARSPARRCQSLSPWGPSRCLPLVFEK